MMNGDKGFIANLLAIIFNNGKCSLNPVSLKRDIQRQKGKVLRYP